MASGYDPHLNRVITHKSTSNWEAIIHLVKCSFGIGVLSLPYAISQAGYVLAIVVGLPLCLTLMYGIHILVRTMYMICTERGKPYIPLEECLALSLLEGPAVVRKSASCVKILLRVLLVSYPIGICIAYVIFISTTLNEMWPLMENMDNSLYLYEVIMLLPIFLINCIPDLHKMTIFSIIANICTIIAFGGLLFFFFSDGSIGGNHFMVGAPLQIPLFTGTVLFALEAISVILTIEENMRTPQSFLGVFGIYNTGMAIVVVIYILIGVTGYLKYGDLVRPSITLNLPSDIYSVIIKILFAISIYCSYPLQCYPVMVVLWDECLSEKISKGKVLLEYLFRFGLALLSVVMAIIMPHFDLVVTLVGAVCIANLGLFFPAFLEYLYYWKQRQGKYNMTMIKDIVIMAIGVTITVSVVSAVVLKELSSQLRLSNNRKEQAIGMILERLYGL